MIPVKVVGNVESPVFTPSSKYEFSSGAAKAEETITLPMKAPTGHPLFYKMTQEEQRLHSEKNSDYAKGGRPLGNFERVGKILSLYPNLTLDNPTIIAVIYMLKQLDACLWLLNTKTDGKVENIGTRLGDVSIYAKLARILNEENPQVSSTLDSTPVDQSLKIIRQGGVNAIRYSGIS